ncbi:MAG: carbohydrate ABC transporter permease [Ruminiclostridium sp.]
MNKNEAPKSIRTLAAMIISNLILILFSITCVFPIIWVLYSSFKTQSEFMLNPIGLPSGLNFTNYFQVLTQTNMPLYMLNSFRNTILSVAGILLLAFVTGYFLSRYRFRGRNLLYNYFVIGMLIPLHALLVPLYIQFKNTHLSNQWYTLLFPYIAFGLPIAIVLVESYILSVPKELEEAAAIDGSGFSRTLFGIVLPVTAPILATAAIIQFFSVWNEFSFALILVSKDTLRTVPVGLATFKSAFTVDYPRMMAGIMFTMLPVMILYFIFSKRIIEGMTSGAVKG